MVPFTIIDQLISVGRYSEAETGDITKDIADLAPHKKINTTGPDFWEAIISDLQTDDLTALVRGLTLAERENHWIGGSAASAIYVFREVQRRSMPLSETVADWVLANTKNPWLPFGSNNHGARSLAEYNEYLEFARRRAREHEAKMLHAKQDREVLSQTRSRTALLRNSPERALAIRANGKLSVKEQLEAIAIDPLYAPNFYSPRCAANASIEILAELSKETRQALLSKLKGKQKGPWGKMKKRLRTIEPLPWE